MRKNWVLSVLIAGGVAAGMLGVTACGGATPVAPTVVTTTETFSGSLSQGTIMVHPFVVAAQGTVVITMTALSGPVSTIAMGMDVGTWDGTNCTSISGSAISTAKVGSVISGTAVPSNLCARVFDVGNIGATDSYTYTLTVLHS